MPGTRLIIRFATAKRWRQALDSEWATGRGVVSCKSPLLPGTHVELRIFVASTHLDLPADVQSVCSKPDGEHHLTLSVRWSDGKRLFAESLTHGSDDSARTPEEIPPVALLVVSESVPPFVIDRSTLGDLPGGPGVAGPAPTPFPPVASRPSATFGDVPETDISLAVLPSQSAADTDLLPRFGDTRDDVEVGAVNRALARTKNATRQAGSEGRAGFPSETGAQSVGERSPSRALELLAEARQAEARGDLLEARRRAVLARAFDPVEPKVQAYLEQLRRRTSR